ncbi:hypothetical protein ACWIVX_03410, partial [Enterobacter asburiae]
LFLIRCLILTCRGVKGAFCDSRLISTTFCLKFIKLALPKHIPLRCIQSLLILLPSRAFQEALAENVG